MNFSCIQNMLRGCQGWPSRSSFRQNWEKLGNANFTNSCTPLVQSPLPYPCVWQALCARLHDCVFAAGVLVYKCISLYPNVFTLGQSLLRCKQASFQLTWSVHKVGETNIQRYCCAKNTLYTLNITFTHIEYKQCLFTIKFK